MKKSLLITLIELPAQIILATICAIKINIQTHREQRPDEDYVSALQRIFTENKDMYAWWIFRWQTPAAVAFYMLLLILAL
jgi:hypothetical protein